MYFYMHSYLRKIFILVKSGCYRGRGGGAAWLAGSACLAPQGQKGRMGRLATALIGPKVEEKFFSDKN
jgi:hypothetical protein